MDRNLYKELWTLRFNKLLKLEKQAIADYQALVAECKNNIQGHSIISHLEKISADEKKHVLLVQELIEILGKQKD